MSLINRNQLFSNALRSLLQSDCALCARTSHRQMLCELCWRDLPRLGHACPRCARPMATTEQCGRCLRKPPHFDATFAALTYRYPVDILITRAKYNGDLALANALGELLCEVLVNAPQIAPIDAVVAVPLSPQRQQQRGYNQAIEIARLVAQHFSCPLRSDLIRTRETQKQADLSFKERLKNVQGAFFADSFEHDLQGKHLALVDDVMTTGATLNEAAKALKSAGAVRVTVCVAARAVSRLKTSI